MAYHFLVGAGLPRPASAAPAVHSAAPEVFRYRIVSEHWHDPKAFTQGLEYGRTCSKQGNCTDFFWESTGGWVVGGCWSVDVCWEVAEAAWQASGGRGQGPSTEQGLPRITVL